MNQMFSYGVGIFPSIALVILVIAGLIHSIHNKRRFRRHDEARWSMEEEQRRHARLAGEGADVSGSAIPARSATTAPRHSADLRF